MAVITRTGTNLQGVSTPGYDSRPVNKFNSDNVTMKVAVQAGQTVQVDTDGKGILGTATRAYGVATIAVPIGGRVAVIQWGRQSGYSGLTPGAAVYLGATGELDTAGTVQVGVAKSATEIQFKGMPV